MGSQGREGPAGKPSFWLLGDHCTSVRARQMRTERFWGVSAPGRWESWAAFPSSQAGTPWEEISNPENPSQTAPCPPQGGESQTCDIFHSVLPGAPRHLRGVENCMICSKNLNRDRKQRLLGTFSGSGPEDVYGGDSASLRFPTGVGPQSGGPGRPSRYE